MFWLMQIQSFTDLDVSKECRQLRKSVSELVKTNFPAAYDENYISADTLKEFKSKVDNCARLLNGYINYLRKAKPPKDEDSPDPNN